MCGGDGEGGCTYFMHSRSRMTIVVLLDPRTPTMSGRSTSGWGSIFAEGGGGGADAAGARQVIWEMPSDDGTLFCSRP